MIFAQILDGEVINAIVLDDLGLVGWFTRGFDYCIQIDNILDINGDPIGIGWLYDGVSFSPPLN